MVTSGGCDSPWDAPMAVSAGVVTDAATNASQRMELGKFALTRKELARGFSNSEVYI
jgi:hypothetical protein